MSSFASINAWLDHFGDKNFAKFMNENYDKFIDGWDKTECISEYNKICHYSDDKEWTTTSFTKAYKQFFIFDTNGKIARKYKLNQSDLRNIRPCISEEDKKIDPSTALMQKINDKIRYWQPFIIHWLKTQDCFNLAHKHWGDAKHPLKQSTEARNYFIKNTQKARKTALIDSFPIKSLDQEYASKIREFTRYYELITVEMFSMPEYKELFDNILKEESTPKSDEPKFSSDKEKQNWEKIIEDKRKEEEKEKKLAEKQAKKEAEFEEIQKRFRLEEKIYRSFEFDSFKEYEDKFKKLALRYPCDKYLSKNTKWPHLKYELMDDQSNPSFVNLRFANTVCRHPYAKRLYDAINYMKKIYVTVELDFDYEPILKFYEAFLDEIPSFEEWRNAEADRLEKEFRTEQQKIKNQRDSYPKSRLRQMKDKDNCWICDKKKGTYHRCFWDKEEKVLYTTPNDDRYQTKRDYLNERDLFQEDENNILTDKFKGHIKWKDSTVKLNFTKKDNFEHMLKSMMKGMMKDMMTKNNDDDDDTEQSDDVKINEHAYDDSEDDKDNEIAELKKKLDLQTKATHKAEKKSKKLEFQLAEKNDEEESCD